MQDRFNFRVWVKDSEEYIQDEAGECHIMHNGELICGDWVDDGYCGHYDYFNDDEVIIEFCIGLRDKNDKLIYDGDILQDSEQKILVKYDVNRHCFMFEYQDTRAYKPICDIDVLSGNFEIIGNIHENADLLENKDE